jgi:hypothetical protein
MFSGLLKPFVGLMCMRRNQMQHLKVFVKLFLPIVDKHVPVKKLRTVRAPWVNELKHGMVQRN